ASDARLTATAKYLQTAAAGAHADTEIVARALASEEAMAREMDVERAEAEQERIAVDAQLADLAETLKRSPQVADAHKILTAIDGMVRERAAGAQQQAAKRAALAEALRDLAGAYEAREKSIQTEISALIIETARWTDYYAARIARAQTECAITNQGPSRSVQR